MAIGKKALSTTIVDGTNATKGILHFDGKFWTSDEHPDFGLERLWVDFDFGPSPGTLDRLDIEAVRWETPYTEYKIWPCRVGLWHDKSVVDVEYDFDKPPVKVYPRILQPGQTWDDIDWDTWSE